jgi:hypothetical protein
MIFFCRKKKVTEEVIDLARAGWKRENIVQRSHFLSWIEGEKIFY